MPGAKGVRAIIQSAATALCIVACVRVETEHVDSAAATIASVGESATANDAVVDTVTWSAPDTSSPARPQAETSSALPTTDSLPLASAQELEELRDALMIPVQGIRAEDLRDTYSAPRSGHTHEALDIIAARGTPVLSATSGRLLELHESRAGGLMVYAADASDRFILMYGHLDAYAEGLVKGASLQRGQIIGYVGTTGNAPPNTPHLHFAIARGAPSIAWWKGEPVNPYALLVR